MDFDLKCVPSVPMLLPEIEPLSQSSCSAPLLVSDCHMRVRDQYSCSLDYEWGIKYALCSPHR
jgi:hypothetical protein